MFDFVISEGVSVVATTPCFAGLVAELQPDKQTAAPNSVMAKRYFIITSSVRRSDGLTFTGNHPFGNRFYNAALKSLPNRRSLLMPARVLLVSMGDLQHDFLAERFSEQLQTDGQLG
jgi:hypothetical protein